jgi:hypothetical protein
VQVQPFVTAILYAFGVGFSVVNLRLVLEYLKFRRRRRSALLIWRGPNPPYYGMALGIGVVLGVLMFYKVFVLHRQVFGESMMFLYYAYLLPLKVNIRRGFYADGIWADTAFIPYNEVGGISWREGEHSVALIVASRLRNLAWRLAVPGDKYGAARRLLRDKIAAHDITFSESGLHLGNHDEREDV